MAPAQGSAEFGLMDLQNAYYMGNYQHCIKEAQKLKGLTDEQAITKDLFLYRSYIAQKKFRVVLDEINSSSPNELQPLRLLALFLSDSSKKHEVLDQVDKIVSGGFDSKDFCTIIICAMIYYHSANYSAALRLLNQGDNLECLAMTIQCLLAYDRKDLAAKELKNMQEKDEDALLTQMATAWVSLAQGAEKLQETYYIAQEIIDKYGSTSLLLNMLAVCYIAQGKYDDADSVLQDALEKDINGADTLQNLYFNASFMGKSQEESSRILSQLKDAHPDHPFFQEYSKKETEFDHATKLFTFSS